MDAQRVSLIHHLMQQGLTMADIGRELGICRERVRQIIKKNELHYGQAGFLTVEQYAKLYHLRYKTVERRILKGTLLATKKGSKWYVKYDEVKKCKRCDQPLPEKHKRVCLPCQKKILSKCLWRRFYLKRGLKLPLAFAYERPPKEHLEGELVPTDPVEGGET